MVLQKHSLRIGRMTDNLMNALTKFRVLLIRRQKLRAYADVARLPVFASIISAIHATSRDCYMQTFCIGRVRQDRVQTKAATSRHPLRTMWMIIKAMDQRPALAGIRGLKQRGRLDATIKRIGFVRVAQNNLPDLFQGGISTCSGIDGGGWLLHGGPRGGGPFGGNFTRGVPAAAGFFQNVQWGSSEDPLRTHD